MDIEKEILTMSYRLGEIVGKVLDLIARVESLEQNCVMKSEFTDVYKP